MMNFLKRLFWENKKIYFISLVVFGLSLIFGLMALDMMTAENQTFLQGYSGQLFDLMTDFDLQKDTYNSSLEFGSLVLHLGILLVGWWLCCYCLFGSVFAFAILAYRGFILGMSIGLLLRWDSTFGLIIMILLLLPVHLVLLPVFFVATQRAVSSALAIGQSGQASGSLLATDLLFFGALFLISMAGAWLQVGIGPLLIKTFIGFI